MTANQKPKGPNGKPPPTEVTFDLIKSNFFRVIYVDGAFGGLSPSGKLHMALFNERLALPTRIVQAIEGDKLGLEIRGKRQSRDTIVRELEIDVVMDVERAIVIRDWLDDKIRQHALLFGTKSPNVTSDEKVDNGL